MQRAAIDIIRMMPAHRHYVEPFGGWLSVLLRKPPCASEIVNDTLTHLTTMYRVLRDDGAALIQRLTVTQYSEATFQEAKLRIGGESDLVTAWAMFVILRQSAHGAGRTFKVRQDSAATWLYAVDRLPQIVRRLRGVVVLNRDACSVISEYDNADTLFYCDPPCPVHRGMDTPFQHEMNTQRHISFVALLKRCRGRVIVEGINHAIYAHAFRDWNRVQFKTINTCKDRHVWINF